MPPTAEAVSRGNIDEMKIGVFKKQNYEEKFWSWGVDGMRMRGMLKRREGEGEKKKEKKKKEKGGGEE